MGWILPRYRYFKSSIRLWNWLCCSKNRISNYLFNWSLQNFRNSTWTAHIYDLLNELNMLDNFEQGLEVNINQTSEKILNLMHQEWQFNLPSKSKLRTFGFFKEQIEQEDHVKTYLKSKRSIFCQLRIGILPLEIELGRYVRTNVSEGICKLCKQDIEDKIHFVCVCPELDCVRLKYSNVLNRSPSLIHKFIEIMSNGNLNWSVNFVFDL